MDRADQFATLEALSSLPRGRVAALAGRNFSGRTHLLRRWTGLGAPSEGSRLPAGPRRPLSAYVGPEVYNALSGLATTVRQELMLAGPDAFQPDRLFPLVERLRLLPLSERNPFTLSGGEQTCLAVVSALAMRPAGLALDCPTEQVDSDLKLILTRWLNRGGGPTSTVIADNRLGEYAGEFREIFRVECEGSEGNGERKFTIGGIAEGDYAFELRGPAFGFDFDAIAFRYGRGPMVLRDVSARLEPSLYFLDGENGAGKSTLAKILSGVLKPRRGRVIVNEREYRPWRQPGQMVAYHFQNPDLQLFSTSVDEEVVAGPRALGVEARESVRRAEAILRAFGLCGVRREHPLDLPFVLRKRLAMAATLAMGCPWTILDEPTLGQDDVASEALARIIESILAAGAGVILITHSRWFRERLRGKTLRLRDGVISVGESEGGALP